jgi:PAS domain S-box-containing protein
MMEQEVDASLPEPGFPRPRVLLLKPDPGLLPALERVLQSLPVERILAGGHEEAAAQLSQGGVVAAIVKGQAAARAMRARSDVPLLVLVEAGAAAPGVPAADVVALPLDPDVLRAKVAFLVDLSRPSRYPWVRAQAVAQACPVGLFQTDPDGRCLYVNPRWCEITGLTPAEASGRGWSSALHPDDRARVLKEWDAAIRARVIFQSEYRFLRPEGTVTWVLGQARAETDAAGRPLSFVGTITDITARKVAEEVAGKDLRKAREELALVADAVPVLISYVGKDGRYVRVNRAYERWFNLRREDVEGRHLRDVLGEEAFARIQPHVEAAFAGHRAAFEGVLPYRTGGTRHVRAEYMPTRDAAGDVTGYIGLVTDVTAAKQGEQALRFLAEAGRVLGSSLEYEDTIVKVANLAVGQLCDWCVVDVVDGPEVRRLAVAHRDPQKVEWARRIQERYPIDLEAPRGVGNVLRTGEPELYPEITDEMLRQGARDEEHLQLLRQAEIRSVMLLPMGGPGRIVGVISCIASAPGRRFGPEDVAVARALAERAALAVENARLYRERTRQKERLQLLADASRLFAESHLDLPELMGRLSDQLVPAVADVCRVRRLAEDGTSIRLLVARHREGMPEGVPLLDDELAGKVLRSGKPEFRPVLDGPSPMGSALMVAMRAGGTVVGALGLGRRTDRDAFTVDDLEMAQKLADRAGLALATWDAFQQVRKEKAEMREVVDDLTRLHDFATRVSGHLDVDRVIRDLLAESIRLQGASMGFVELVDPRGRGLVVAASIGHRPEAAAQLGIVPIAEGQGACGTAGARRERVIVEDVEADPLFAPFRDFARWAGFRAAWSVPMMGRGGELLGVLTTHAAAPRRPTPREVHMVELYAAQAAHVVENAGLMRDARRAEAEARRLNADLEARVRERTATLQETLRELETFSYSVAHDLRAPLRAMEGFGQILLESYADKLDAEGQDMVRRICTAGIRMDRMVQDLLAYSRLSRESILLAPVGLDGVVDDALQLVSSAVEASAARVDVARPLPEVLGNAAMLAQAVANLFSNAVKFVAAGTTPHVRVRSSEAGGRVRLWIEDNGIGIEPDHQARIFRVFERLHGASEYPGTGIGLAIVRRVLERMGGAVGVESEAGRGSRFWIELPAA